MLNLVGILTRTHARWSAELRRGFCALGLGRSAEERLSGDARVDQVAARYFFAALAPFLVLGLWDGLEWRRGALFHGWMVISCAWAVLVLGPFFWSVVSVAREVLKQAAERRRREGR